MNKIIEILKGIIIGIANIVPGVSGGTLAIVMGIYDKLINAVTELFKKPIESIKSVWVYILGIGIGVASSIIGVSYFIDAFPVPTTALFVGLIIGAIPLIISKVNSKKIGNVDIISFCLLMVSVLILPYIGTSSSSDQALNNNFIIMFGIGIIGAFTIVVPGVSGTMILMALGYYESIMEMASSFIKAIISFDMSAIFSNGIALMPFGIGIIVGVILTAKLIKWLLQI
ncbi:hypothetical protein D3C76_989520 [compost metagenome]